jgi:hypothetical protein
MKTKDYFTISPTLLKDGKRPNLLKKYNRLELSQTPEKIIIVPV